MFDPDRFVADCRAALVADAHRRAVTDLVRAAVADPQALIQALGEPEPGAVRALYRSPELTILNVVWRPEMVLFPHNHEMWAVIGVYAGREDNILWKRLDETPGRIEAAGARSVGEGQILSLGPEAIHSVVNPLGRATGAIHVYGGDFFAQARSAWDPETLDEQPYDIGKVNRAFAR